MCSPTLVISAASNGLRLYQAQRESEMLEIKQEYKTKELRKIEY